MNIKKEGKDTIARHFERLLEVITGAMPHLDAEKQYTLKAMVGKYEWASFPREYRPQLGSLFSGYVKENKLPLEHSGTNTSNAILYVKR